MQLVTLFCMLSLAYGGGGVTKSSGISEFWTDDYKVFEQIYGKTSDRDLYGENLPSISSANLGKLKKPEASDKKERFIDSADFSDFDKYSFGERYAKIFAKQILEDEEKTTKPPKLFNFISYSDFKPISQFSDPETYNYLKHLEQYKTEAKVKFPKGIGGFKPLNKAEPDPEEHAYKSIQDILDAHEANKGGANDDDDERDEQIQYLTYPPKGRKKSSSRKKPGSGFSKPRCWTGRCRKRASSSVRVRTRPYIRKITQNRWSSG